MKPFIKYVNPETNNISEISANTAMSYLHKTYDTKGYRDHTPQTKKGIERATRRVSQAAMQRDYERSSRLGLSTEEKLKEVSDTTLASYVRKAKASADELEKQKKFGKALTRRMGVLSAVSKQVGRAGEKLGKLARNEEVEMIDEKVSVISR